MKKLLIGNKLNRSISGNLSIFAFLAIFGAFSFMPMIYAIAQAFKPMEEVFLFPPRFFVRNPTLENFTMMFKLTSNLWVPFSRYLFNSLFVSITGTVGHVIIASMAAFPLAKKKFPGRNIIFSVVMISLLFVREVTFIPQYIVMSKIGLIDTYWAIILPAIAMSLGLYLMRQFMVGIPDEMLEAAKIDGASEYKVFFTIVMPMVKPAWLTLIIFSFQSIWNNNGVAFIYNESLKFLPTALQQIATGGIARVGVGAAAALFLMIPPILTFVITQSNVIQTMSHSGMKG